MKSKIHQRPRNHAGMYGSHHASHVFFIALLYLLLGGILIYALATASLDMEKELSQPTGYVVALDLPPVQEAKDLTHVTGILSVIKSEPFATGQRFVEYEIEEVIPNSVDPSPFPRTFTVIDSIDTPLIPEGTASGSILRIAGYEESGALYLNPGVGARVDTITLIRE